MSEFIFASVKYANAAPLAHFLTEVCPTARVVYDRPSELTGMLLSGEVHAALIPVIDYLENPGLNIIDGVGICADGDVHSVILKCNCPLTEVQKIAKDPASKTSNALAKVIFEKHLKKPVELLNADSAEEFDASIIIGDRALTDPESKYEQYDLASLWKEMTGLPFVFAVWAYRNDEHDHERLIEIILSAKKLGMSSIDELAAIHSEKLGISLERCREYLTSSIKYDLGPKEMEAINLFKQLTGNA